jgi:hypothetical protein
VTTHATTAGTKLISNAKTYLLLLHRLEDLNDAFIVTAGSEALEHLAVLPPPKLPQHLVPILLAASKREDCTPSERTLEPQIWRPQGEAPTPCIPPLDVERLVVPVLLGPLGVGVGVDARHGGGAPGVPRGPPEARRHGQRRLGSSGVGRWSEAAAVVVVVIPVARGGSAGAGCGAPRWRRARAGARGCAGRTRPCNRRAGTGRACEAARVERARRGPSRPRAGTHRVGRVPVVDALRKNLVKNLLFASRNRAALFVLDRVMIRMGRAAWYERKRVKNRAFFAQ